MGIWDYVSSATELISGGVMRSRKKVGGAAGKERETAIWTSQVVVERKIVPRGCILLDHAIDKGPKTYTGGIPVYRYVKEALSNNKSQEEPLKEKMENTELAKLKATIQILEKKNMEMDELGQRKENLEKKLVEIN